MENNTGQNTEQEIVQQSSSQQGEVFDAQTLENLAAFLSRDTNATQGNNQEENENEEENTGNEEEEADDDHLEPEGEDVHEDHDNGPEKKRESPSRSRSRSRDKSQPRWLYCCSGCKKNGMKGKNCVCVVPATQRRIPLNKKGCSVCACSGCSKEDIQMKQEKKKLEEMQDSELMRNGCCKECMKAFSANGKACLCQVPATVRRRKLPETGCLYCGCKGCNPEDLKHTDKHGRAPELKITRDDDRGAKFVKGTSGRNRGRRSISPRSSRSRSRSRSYSRSRSRSRSRSQESYHGPEEPLDNFNNSFIGAFLRNNFNIYPPLMGFGIPQRTYSYIYGKPPHH